MMDGGKARSLSQCSSMDLAILDNNSISSKGLYLLNGLQGIATATRGRNNAWPRRHWHPWLPPMFETIPLRRCQRCHSVSRSELLNCTIRSGMRFEDSTRSLLILLWRLRSTKS